MKHKQHATVRIIAGMLIMTFLAQDIVWANPSNDYKNLAVTGLKNEETLRNLKTVMNVKKNKRNKPAGPADYYGPMGSPELNIPHIVEKIYEENPGIKLEDLLKVMAAHLSLSSTKELLAAHPDAETEAKK